nr:MAG TPA: Protein of unknown function (DUF1643) [Caudoviricetes sp.]
MGRIWGETPTKPDKSIAFNPSTAFFIGLNPTLY